MESNEWTLTEALQCDPSQLRKAELLTVCKLLQQFIANLDAKVIYYNMRIGQPAALLTRFGRRYVGVLTGVYYDVSELEIATEMQEYDTGKGKNFREVKTVRLPASALSQFEILYEREEVREEEHTDGVEAESIASILEGG